MPTDTDSPVTWSSWLEGLRDDFRTRNDPRYQNALIMVLFEGEVRGISRPSRCTSNCVYARYVASILDGCTKEEAHERTFPRVPALLTDSVFLAGNTNGSQFESQPEVGDYYKWVAEAAGVNVKGLLYVPGLALFPGDPKAWVSGRGDVERVCRERGFTATGAVNVQGGRGDVPPEDVDVAPDIVEQRVLDRLEADPSLAFRPPDEVLHETKEMLRPHWAK